MKAKILLILSIFTILIVPVSVNATGIEIRDSTQLNLNTINKISTKTGTSGSIPIGSIITWFHDADPEDNNCTSAKTGGNGSGGKCKWLECNGQFIDTSIYTEYAEVVPEKVLRINTVTGKEYWSSTWNRYTKNTPNFQEHFVPYGYKSYWGGLNIKLEVTGYSRLPLEDYNPDHHVDGIVSLETGGVTSISQGKIDYESEDEGYKIYSPFSQNLETKEILAKGAVDHFVTVRYLIRVSN